MNREDPCMAPTVPTGMSADVMGYRWARDRVGESGGSVYRLHGRPEAPDLFLKQGNGAVADDIADEMARLRWLAGRISVPAVRHFVCMPGAAWLLMTALPGQTAWQLLDASPDVRLAVVDALALFLRRFHAIPVNDCPFTGDHAYRLARARIRIDAGLVDEEDFDAERSGWTAEQVWEAMQRLLPFTPDPVVTHGDFSLDNLLVHNGQVTGCIDVGRVGIADRYQDVAMIWSCLGEFGASLQERFLIRYGITDADRCKLQFHLMLDELF